MARLSPWVFAGIGCLGVVALGVVSIGGIGLMVAKNIKEEMAKPIDKAAVLRDLNVPIHPNATLDEATTRSLRAGMASMARMTNLQMSMAAFQLGAPADEVLSWYEKELEKQGYQKKVEDRELSLRYERKDRTISISVTKSGLLTITHMKTPGK
jgi:hypothetical protein